jgi:hypothetical protein
VKKLITVVAGLALQAACHSAPPSTTAPRPVTSTGSSSGLTGAPDATAAVRTFMSAANLQDLQALGGIWGDVNGPARDAISREELEKRELIMLKCLRHDRYDIVGDAPSSGGSRTMAVSVTYRDVSTSSNFTVVRGPANRWYVQNVDLDSLQKICAAK